MVVDIPDVVTYTNFGDHLLKVFWVAGGQIFPSPIDFHRRPYNTLALPCECVMIETTATWEINKIIIMIVDDDVCAAVERLPAQLGAD